MFISQYLLNGFTYFNFYFIFSLIYCLLKTYKNGPHLFFRNFFLNFFGRKILRRSTAVYLGMYIENVWKMEGLILSIILEKCYMYDIYVNNNILAKITSYNMCGLGRSSIENCGIKLRFS